MKNTTLSELLHFFIQSKIGIKITDHGGSGKSDDLVQYLLANKNTIFHVAESALELTLSKHADNPILGELASKEHAKKFIEAGRVASEFSKLTHQGSTATVTDYRPDIFVEVSISESNVQVTEFKTGEVLLGVALDEVIQKSNIPTPLANTVMFNLSNEEKENFERFLEGYNQ